MRKFLSPVGVTASFGIPVQSPILSPWSKPRVFLTITQSQMKPLLQNFTESGKLDRVNVLSSNVGNANSAMLSSMAPS